MLGKIMAVNIAFLLQYILTLTIRNELGASNRIYRKEGSTEGFGQMAVMADAIMQGGILMAQFSMALVDDTRIAGSGYKSFTSLAIHMILGCILGCVVTAIRLGIEYNSSNSKITRQFGELHELYSELSGALGDISDITEKLARQLIWEKKETSGVNEQIVMAIENKLKAYAELRCNIETLQMEVYTKIRTQNVSRLNRTMAKSGAVENLDVSMDIKEIQRSMDYINSMKALNDKSVGLSEIMKKYDN